MICVSIGRARHKRMIAEHQHLVEQGVQLVELRLDYIGRAVSLTRLLDNRPGPAIVTVRRRGDGGRWTKTEQERLMLLRSAIAAGVEYVDIEADVAAQIPRYGDTKRIISFHRFQDTPENLEELHEAMADEDADIVKIATMANSFKDCMRMMDLCRNAKVPTIGICMGEAGMITRLLAKRNGAPFTFASHGTGKRLAPGQLDWKEMQDLYRYDQIDDQTEFFGVVANPVGHSYSPLIHNTAFESEGINARYFPFQITAGDLPNFLKNCRSLGVRGLSVTIPHKESAMTYCTQAESSATGIGAINTMIMEDDDETLGYNTDYRAAMDCIEEKLEIKKGQERPLQGKRALILGAGGVSRAVAWGLRQRSAEVFIASRNRDRADLLAAEIGCRAVDWEFRHDQKFHLLVNGTPVGMHPDVDNTPFSASHLNQYMVVFDTVYNPENTLLIKQAKAAQARVITGTDMFVRQAAYQYKLFTGREAPAKLMRKTIKDATNPVQLN